MLLVEARQRDGVRGRESEGDMSVLCKNFLDFFQTQLIRSWSQIDRSESQLVHTLSAAQITSWRSLLDSSSRARCLAFRITARGQPVLLCSRAVCRLARGVMIVGRDASGAQRWEVGRSARRHDYCSTSCSVLVCIRMIRDVVSLSRASKQC